MHCNVALSSPSLFIVVKLMVIDFFLIKGTFPIFARFTEILVFLCFIVLNPWGEGLIQSTYSCQLTPRHPQPCQCSAAVPPPAMHPAYTAHCTLLHTLHSAAHCTHYTLQCTAAQCYTHCTHCLHCWTETSNLLHSWYQRRFKLQFTGWKGMCLTQKWSTQVKNCGR